MPPAPVKPHPPRCVGPLSGAGYLPARRSPHSLKAMRADARLLLAVAASGLLTCHAHANRPDVPAATRASDPTRGGKGTTRVFDPDVVVPSSAVAGVRQALDAGSPGEAVERARRALNGAGDAERPRLQWLLAKAKRRDGHAGQSLEWLARVAESDHPLAPWAALLRGELLEATHPAAAVAAVGDLADERWAGRGRARLVRARALMALDRAAEAVPELRALVAAAPDRVGAASPGMPLAEWLEASGEPEGLEEALGLYRRVATRAPLTGVGREAAERANRILSKLPTDRRGALADVPLDDAFARAHALYGSMRHQEAEDAFAALARQLDGNPERRCEAELYQGKAMLRRRERTAAAQLLGDVAERCTDRDVRARARFLTAQAHGRLGHNEQAMAHYAVVEKEAPDHRLADDALFRAALAAGDRGDVEGMVRRLEALPDRYPQGDMRSEALFRLAWRARSEGRHQDALGHLDRLLQQGEDGRQEGEVGRTAYWRARTLEDAGRHAEAATAYTQVIHRWPLGYHAQHALGRLDALDAQAAGRVRALFERGRSAEGLPFTRRPELAEPGFLRALELLQVGEVDLAMAELEHSGALGAGADRGLLWLVGALLDRAGAHPQASRLTRTRLAHFRRTLPAGRAHGLWRIAYPQAFSPLIEQVAQGESLPPSFVRAVAREESAFDPNAVSVAHARGLIQIITPTAQRFARELDLPSDPSSLHRPEVNLRIGARFIRYLFDRYRDNPAVVPAAYNAGEGAANRWLRARPDMPLDEWVEAIPYDETRRYTRRVLETWGIYRYLDEGELTVLPQALPTGG
jgi:soluble lytic murein transglycosylase